MHSSRMRTDRSLSVCYSLLPGVGGGGVMGGVVLVRGVLLGRQGGFSLAGGSPWQTPTVNRMTDRCKNITLATTSLRPVTRMNSSKMRAMCCSGHLSGVGGGGLPGGVSAQGCVCPGGVHFPPVNRMSDRQV